MRDPEVWRYFNGTFLAFERSWGDEELRMANLNLHYDVAYLGADAAPEAIQSRLDAGLPTFFYLWSPHPLNARYNLNRIELPTFTPALFDQGRSDYPTDVLVKVASKKLAEFAPAVAELYSNFEIDNAAQESILAMIGEARLSTMQAVCSWLRRGNAVWQAWVPAEKRVCDLGNYAVNETSCAPCPPGSSSVGGAATACVQCPAGAKPPLCASLSHSRAISCFRLGHGANSEALCE